MSPLNLVPDTSILSGGVFLCGQNDSGSRSVAFSVLWYNSRKSEKEMIMTSVLMKQQKFCLNSAEIATDNTAQALYWQRQASFFAAYLAAGNYIEEGNEAIVNLCPHPINFTLEGGETLEIPAAPKELQSTIVARVKTMPTTNTPIGKVGRVNLYQVPMSDELINMPDVVHSYNISVFFIVALPCRVAMPDRQDVGSPRISKRDETGKPVEWNGLDIN